jgi:3-deoxy-manno-octulosonate cytidylyltransferase (CMP-KDO synthetase)
VIPARYKSSRLPGKPLADICGKPMIWWVYHQVSQVDEFDKIFVATDDERIKKVCEEYKMPVLMTSSTTPNHIHRIWEVTEIINADYYVSVNGDEPLINPDNIKQVLRKTPKETTDFPYFGSVYRELSDPVETIDLSNVKIVLGSDNKCLYQSRNPIPSTKGSLNFKYKKAIGIECFNKKALDFFVSTPMGILEKIEDIDHLRFIENGIPIYYTKIESESLSVDTKNDLEKVRKIIQLREDNSINEKC